MRNSAGVITGRRSSPGRRAATEETFCEMCLQSLFEHGFAICKFTLAEKSMFNVSTVHLKAYVDYSRCIHVTVQNLGSPVQRKCRFQCGFRIYIHHFPEKPVLPRKILKFTFTVSEKSVFPRYVQKPALITCVVSPQLEN